LQLYLYQEASNLQKDDSSFLALLFNIIAAITVRDQRDRCGTAIARRSLLNLPERRRSRSTAYNSSQLKPTADWHTRPVITIR